jgi:glycosyltransferase involved in cell wall biosynthesis
MTAPPPDPGLDASVVIPSYNNKQTLIPCIEHLARQTHPFSRFEVVVVLDGSSDGSAAALRAMTLPMKLTIIEQENRGRAAAINRGAAAARGTYLVVTDGDILVNPEFVSSHVAAHARGDVVIGPIPLSDRSPESFLTDGVKEWADEHTAKMLARSGDIGLTEIYGANWSAPLAVFRRLGGHREDLRRGEDWELGKKFIEAGLRIVFCPTAVAAQIYDKTIAGWCHDWYVDGKSHARMAEEFPAVKKDLLLGAYYPMTLAKRLLRPLVIHRHPLGNLAVALMQGLLEAGRRRGLRWKILAAGQGLVGDCLYFRGVYDALGDRKAFDALVRPD